MGDKSHPGKRSASSTHLRDRVRATSVPPLSDRDKGRERLHCTNLAPVPQAARVQGEAIPTGHREGLSPSACLSLTGPSVLEGHRHADGHGHGARGGSVCLDVAISAQVNKRHRHGLTSPSPATPAPLTLSTQLGT